MKKKPRNFKFFIIIFAVVVIFFLFSTSIKQSKSSINFETEPMVINNDVRLALQGLGAESDIKKALQELQTGSIVSTNIVFVNSDQNEFEKFLDEEKPLGQTATPTFTLETSATLIDQNGNQVSKSSFLNIPQLSLTDEQGNVLIGSAQIGFFGKTTEDAEIDAVGTVEFWLDDKLVATKKVFFKPDGIPKKTHNLFLDDMIKNTIINQVPRAFTYKFTDEPFEDLSTHTFRVIIKDFTAETIKQDERKKYNWSGEFLAYQLIMSVDKSQITITDESGQSISVFKDDNKLIVCDVATNNIKPINHVPSITVVRKSDNQVITTVDVRKGTDENECAIFSGLQRSTDYLFHMEGKVYEITTPRIQQNYYASCSALVDTNTGGHIGDKCVSTFAIDWDYVYDIKAGQKFKINSVRLKVCGSDGVTFIGERFDHGGNHGSYIITWTSPSPHKAPLVEVFDGTTKLGQAGDKTYCNFLTDLPKGKELTVKVGIITDRGKVIESNPSAGYQSPTSFGLPYNVVCLPPPNNPPCNWKFMLLPDIPEKIVKIITPENSAKEFTLSCRWYHQGSVKTWVSYQNPNISPSYESAGWEFNCGEPT